VIFFIFCKVFFKYLENKMVRSFTSIIFSLVFVSVLHAQGLQQWKAIDTMLNTYSTALPNLSPIASADFSPLIMVLHRAGPSYFPSSGALVYNLSTDNGLSWARKLPPINSQIGYGARYPSLALKLDSGQAISTAKAFSSFIHADSFGEMTHGVALVSDVQNAVSNSMLFSPNVFAQTTVQTCWASDTGNNFFWVTQQQGTGDYLINRTSNLPTVESFNIINAVDIAGAIIPLQGQSHRGKLYFGFLAGKPGTGNPPMYFPAYVTSTDNGVSWSRINWVDFRQAVGLSRFDRLWDYKPSDGFVSYSADMVVGYNGLVHFAIGLQDTNMTVDQNRNAIVDLTQTGSYWSGYIASDNLRDISYSRLDGPAAGQMGYSVNIAASKFFGIYALTFVHPNKSNPQDSLCDIYFTSRIEGVNWHPPFNLTNTPGKNENNHHMSSRIYTAIPFYHHYADIIYNYPTGYDGHFPNGQGIDNQPSTIYFNQIDILIPLSPVEFTSFSAERVIDGVQLSWATASENNNNIFIVERNSGKGYTEIGSVKGAGNSTEMRNYSFTDKNTPNDLVYRIKQIDFDGDFVYSEEIAIANASADEFSLLQNFPNPFNPVTTISYRLTESGFVSLKIFDTHGELVQTLVSENKERGEYKVEFPKSGANLSSGVYYYELLSGGKRLINKMVLLK
jgi:hypothetical protein